MSKINRRQYICYSILSIATGLITSCNINTNTSQANISQELDKITLGINWFAEAEYGGFYQALATGIYKEYGLDVTIRQGGPRVNNTQLLMSGIVDFCTGNAINSILSVESNIPKTTIASLFQKTPSILVTHPNVGNDSLEDLKGKPIYMAQYTVAKGSWLFLKEKYGFTDEQIRPYNSNITPFLKSKNSVQQGILSSEPYTIEKEAGFKPIVFLLADYGYNPYSFTLDTRTEIVNNNPDLVQRFVDASIKGWYSYLENPNPANELIKKDNPEMTDGLIAYSIEKMKEYDIITSGDAKTKGIGAMSQKRWQEFFETQVSLGIFNAETDYTKAFTLNFINKGAEYFK